MIRADIIASFLTLEGTQSVTIKYVISSSYFIDTFYNFKGILFLFS